MNKNLIAASLLMVAGSASAQFRVVPKVGLVPLAVEVVEQRCVGRSRLHRGAFWRATVVGFGFGVGVGALTGWNWLILSLLGGGSMLAGTIAVLKQLEKIKFR